MKQSETFYPLGERLKDVEENLTEIENLLKLKDLSIYDVCALQGSRIKALQMKRVVETQIEYFKSQFCDN